MLRRSLLAAVLALALTAAHAPVGAAKGVGMMAAPAGVTVAGSPYRYVAVHPRVQGAPTVVARVDRNGGRLRRWWYLRGDYQVPAVAYDGSAGGLSADGGTLVLSRFTFEWPPRETRFAVLDTGLHLRHPDPSGQRPAHAFHHLDLPGFYSFDAISSDGRTVFLSHHLVRGRDIDEFEIRAMDTATGRLAPGPVPGGGRAGQPLSGLPITRATSGDGRLAYTLYFGAHRRISLLALDTVSGRVRRLALPMLRRRSPFLLQLGFGPAEHELVVRSRSAVAGRPPSQPLLRIDTRLLRVKGAYASIRVETAGHSAGGRPIQLEQVGNTTVSGSVLVFGCVHGTECVARHLMPLSNGCPDPYSNLYLVPNLDPDGLATGTRLNGHGVDLNRNFATAWQPIGARGDPEYSGPQPFSEPESRVAARLIRQLRPRLTIWFHQHWQPRPLVRAWGQSAPAARRFADLAGLPFRLLPWMDGTAPNWQNHHFPNTSSFVVELPPGELAAGMERRLNAAVLAIARQVGED
jgi:protein MpaA